MTFPRFILMISIACMTIILFAGCGGGSNTTTSTASGDTAELQQAINAYNETVAKGDIKGRADAYTDDAMMMPNGWDIIKGKAEVQKVVASGGDSAVYQIKDLEQVEIKVCGDIGYTVNRFSYSFNFKNQPPQWHKSKSINIWARQPGGSWKLHAELWNSSVPRGM